MPTPDQLTTDKKIAVLIAEGLEEVEALAVVDLLNLTDRKSVV